jgi:hypothetical protein
VQVADGGQQDAFHLDRETCKSKSVAPGETCTVLVRFHPTAPGFKSHAKLVFADDADRNIGTVELSGLGTSLDWDESALQPAD